MQADMDGDTMMVFGAVPGDDVDPPGLPSAIGRDEVLNRAVFYAGKQYIYGLHLLQKDTSLRDHLNEKLENQGAPQWPTDTELTAKAAFEQWAAAASNAEGKKGSWWGTVEWHALKALAGDPGMGLGLCKPEDLLQMDAVTCGAAKKEVFEDFKAGSELYYAYRGQSLEIYACPNGQAGGQAARDLIAEVMVANAENTGNFGNVPRRMLYAARELKADFVCDVQALSEQANQQVLSVKAGKGGLDFKSFNKHVLEPLTQGIALAVEEMPEAIRAFIDKPAMLEACDRIRQKVYPKVPGWLKWLLRPGNLGEILEEEGGQIELPLDDPRVQPFLAE